MHNVPEDEAVTLQASMTAEWKSVLATPEDLCTQECLSAGDQAYWSPQSVSKVRRVQSEPMSPSTAGR